MFRFKIGKATINLTIKPGTEKYTGNVMQDGTGRKDTILIKRVDYFGPMFDVRIRDAETFEIRFPDPQIRLFRELSKTSRTYDIVWESSYRTPYWVFHDLVHARDDYRLSINWLGQEAEEIHPTAQAEAFAYVEGALLALENGGNHEDIDTLFRGTKPAYISRYTKEWPRFLESPNVVIGRWNSAMEWYAEMTNHTLPHDLVVQPNPTA